NLSPALSPRHSCALGHGEIQPVCGHGAAGERDLPENRDSRKSCPAGGSAYLGLPPLDGPRLLRSVFEPGGLFHARRRSGGREVVVVRGESVRFSLSSAAREPHPREIL